VAVQGDAVSKDILDELSNAYSFLRDPWIGKSIDEIARQRRLIQTLAAAIISNTILMEKLCNQEKISLDDFKAFKDMMDSYLAMASAEQRDAMQ
jgi:hypothetical protein